MKTNLLSLVMLALSFIVHAQLPPTYSVGNSLYSYQAEFVQADGTNYRISNNSGILDFNRAGLQGVRLPHIELEKEIFQKKLVDNSIFHLGSQANDGILVYKWIRELDGDVLESGEFEHGESSILNHNIVFVEGTESQIYLIDREYIIEVNMLSGAFNELVTWEYETISNAILDEGILYAVTREGQIVKFDLVNNEATVEFDDANYNFHGIENVEGGFIAYGDEIEENAIVLELDETLQLVQTHTFDLGYVTDVFVMPSGDWLIAKSSQYSVLFAANSELMRVIPSTDAIVWEKEIGKGYGQFIHKFSNNMYVIDLVDQTHDVLYFWENGVYRDDVHFLNGKYEYFDKNNIRTPFSNIGGLFNVTGVEALYVPENAATSTIFMGGLWMKGTDGAGELHDAASTYSPLNGNSDYQAGLINETSKAYKQVWKLEDYQLQVFLEDWTDGVLDLDIPYPILTWPAKGNPHFRSINYDYTGIDQELAAFEDVNNDGIYNAHDGDYPKVKGDQTLFWIMNDGENYEESYNEPMGVDIIAMVYGYKSSTDINKHSTIFLDFEIINSLNFTYSDYKLAYWQDIDLGCPIDDATAIIPEENLVIYYNWDEEDGAFSGMCPGGVEAFNELPVQTTKFINHDIDKFITTSTIGEAIPNWNGDFNKFTYVDGYWPNGFGLTQGGWGYNDGIGTTDYQFAGNPSDPNTWSMCNLEQYAHDMRTVATTNIGDFAPGDRVELKMAFTTLFDRGTCPNIEEIAIELEALDELVDTQESASQESQKIYLSPNPTTEIVNIDWEAIDITDCQIKVLNLNGQLLKIVYNQNSINVSDLPSGIYILQVQSEGRLVGAEKFIKTNAK